MFYRVFPLEELRPNAAGDLTGLTPLAGANYTNVDEVTADGDTSYVSSSSVGSSTLRDLYNLPNPTNLRNSVLDKVLYVRPIFTSKYSTDNGTVQAFSVIKENATQDDGTATTVTASYVERGTFYFVKPSDGLKWTYTDIQGAQTGVGHITSGALKNPSVVRTTQCTLNVSFFRWRGGFA